MENLQSIEAVGVTVEDAIARGLDALNASLDQVNVQVIDQGQRATPQTRACEARVRLTLKEREQVMQVANDTLQVDCETAAQNAAQTLQELLDKMRIRAHIESHWDVCPGRDNGSELRLTLDIRGNDLGVLIGRQSETINALQYLTRLIVARESEGKFDLVVDVEGYKSRRENQLKQLAVRMAERVASTRKPVALEPMPPHERRIVHITLRDHPSVMTESVGYADRRKVTIVPKKK